MKKWVKFGVAGAIVIAVIGYLLFSGLSQHSIYYLEVTELVNNPDKYDAKGTRLSGEVVEGSVVKDVMDSKLLKFAVADSAGAAMDVQYAGMVPDAFEEGVTVILEGRYDPAKKVFLAKTLMAKCPSKYEGQDPSMHPDSAD